MTELVGVRETMAELRRLDKTLFFAATKKIKTAALPLAAAVNASVPAQSPFANSRRDGFAHGGRTGWAKRGKATVKYGGRKYRGRPDAWPLVRIVFSGAAGEMVDMAGTGTLGQNLPGSPSRYIWPAVNANENLVDAALKAAVVEASDQVNKRIGVRGGGVL